MRRYGGVHLQPCSGLPVQFLGGVVSTSWLAKDLLAPGFPRALI